MLTSFQCSSFTGMTTIKIKPFYIITPESLLSAHFYIVWVCAAARCSAATPPKAPAVFISKLSEMLTFVCLTPSTLLLVNFIFHIYTDSHNYPLLQKCHSYTALALVTMFKTPKITHWKDIAPSDPIFFSVTVLQPSVRCIIAYRNIKSLASHWAWLDL